MRLQFTQAHGFLTEKAGFLRNPAFSLLDIFYYLFFSWSWVAVEAL